MKHFLKIPETFSHDNIFDWILRTLSEDLKCSVKMSLVECRIESSSLDAVYLWQWDDGVGPNLILGALFADLVI